MLAVFRSFPFRTPAAPEGNGAGSLVEETQAPPPPPPAYNNGLAREPEEAGEVTPAQADPENVGEDAGAQPAVSGLSSEEEMRRAAGGFADRFSIENTR